MHRKEPISAQPLIANDATVTPWAEGCRRLAQGDFYWLATVRPDGRPHVVPLLAVWLEDALYFSTSATSRKARNLAHESHCVITTACDDAHLVVEGAAARVRDEATLQRVAAMYAAKYGWHVSMRDGAFYADGAPTAGPPPYEVYRVTPTLIFGFGTDASFAATRWRF